MLGEEIAARGWRTGSVVPTELAHSLSRYFRRGDGEAPLISEDDWVVVVSQACDVVARTVEQEPLLEVLHCKPIPKLRSQFKDLRSTRTLDFRPNREAHESVTLSAHAVRDRYCLPREALSTVAPDGVRHLSAVATSRVMAWLALRYGRPAWPDAFVERLRPVSEDLEKILEPLRDDLAEVRIGIAEKMDELPASSNYHVTIFFVVDEAIWEDDAEARALIYTAFSEFAAKVDGCPGVEVDHELSGAVSGGEFSWQATRLTDEWNFANLSHRD